MYVDQLIAPDTVTTLTEATIAAFEDHGIVESTIESRTVASSRVLEQLAGVGINMREVANKLENEGVAAFTHSFDQLLATLQPKVWMGLASHGS